MVGFSAFVLGQNLPEQYNMAVIGGVLATGGIMVLHAYSRNLKTVESLYEGLKHGYKRSNQKKSISDEFSQLKS